MIALVIILCLITWHAIKRYKQSKTETDKETETNIKIRYLDIHVKYLDIHVKYLDMIAWSLIAFATIAHTFQMLVHGYVVDYISIGI